MQRPKRGPCQREWDVLQLLRVKPPSPEQVMCAQTEVVHLTFYCGGSQVCGNSEARDVMLFILERHLC